jgi:hypothetical protein
MTTVTAQAMAELRQWAINHTLDEAECKECGAAFCDDDAVFQMPPDVPNLLACFKDVSRECPVKPSWRCVTFKRATRTAVATEHTANGGHAQSTRAEA